MNKLAILLIAGLPFVSLAEEKKTTKAPAPAAKKAAPDPAAVTIPADAKKNSDNTYEKTDEKGRTWIYAQTPFGITKYEKTAASEKPAASAPPPQGYTAVEDGDSIRFERPSPFGKFVWSRKKTELTDEERAVWERQKQTTAKREQ
jgi:hypothetical protein